MQLAYSVPWWLVVLVAAAVCGLTFAQYRRPLRPLTRTQLIVLVGCRLLVLATLVLFLLRPIVLLPPLAGRESVVPVLVDVSRSMRVSDADGQARLTRATALLRNELLPALARRFTPQLYSVGERLEPASIEQLSADAPRSDLTGALTAVRDRYRGRQVAAIVLLSDGGDTGQSAMGAMTAADPPVFTVGLGSADRIRDREVTGLTAGEQRLDQASIDLQVAATSSGYGRTPFSLRLLSNGREVDERRLVPQADGAPTDGVFTVSPDPVNPTVYTAEISPDEAEPVAENNARSVLVNPAGRRRRLLIMEGAPGFEHGFMKRAWLRDPSLEADAVGRKGKDAQGHDTFYVQANPARAAALTEGFPQRREDLYTYDGLVIANVEADFFTEAQLAMMADFVAERGGGLLLVGGRSFAPRGLAGTPLEHVLPIELSDRHGWLPATSVSSRSAPSNKVVVTAEGENHPTMRIGETAEETRRLWTALPALAASAPLGGPRPGATVLAVTTLTTGAVHPVVAVQRYGRGRSMIFAGEASWRWKMMLASTDRSYEHFWRQAARWIVGMSPDQVAIVAPEGVGVGDDLTIVIKVRDAVFAPVGDASVEATLTAPGGDVRPLGLRRSDAADGRYTVDLPTDQPGVHRVSVAARRGTAVLGTAVRWLYVGGVDREFVDPRLNESWLRRVARASGGRYVRPGEASRIAGWLQDAALQRTTAPERRDLWHEPWAFVLIVGLLSTEWILRRRWGLR